MSLTPTQIQEALTWLQNTTDPAESDVAANLLVLLEDAKNALSRWTDALDFLADLLADSHLDRNYDHVTGYLWCLQNLGLPIQDPSEADTYLSLLAAGLVEIPR
jgi:hypothetical protein